MPYQWTVEVDVTGDLNDDRLDRLAELGLCSMSSHQEGTSTLWFDWSCGCPDCPPPPTTADEAVSRVEAALCGLSLERGPIKVYDAGLDT